MCFVVIVGVVVVVFVVVVVSVVVVVVDVCVCVCVCVDGLLVLLYELMLPLLLVNDLMLFMVLLLLVPVL